MKSKLLYVILGIIIVVMNVFFINQFYTIKIRQEINLSDEEKNVVNEYELIKDIKSYEKTSNFIYAKHNSYTSEDAENMTIPAYDGSVYGDGYSANSYSGKFMINGRCVYEADTGSLFQYIMSIVAISVIEIVILVIILIKRKKTKW
ncbi:MAG: hypothetical protein J6D03_11325 [Clostridia bacterium]|nr:hypothetical protein [Clostridia bacterium]